MNGCSFKKYNPRSVSEEYPEQTVRVKDVCPDPVFLDGRCFTHARIAEQLPQIMDGWKLGKKTPFLQHAVNGGQQCHKSPVRTGRPNKGRILPLYVMAEPRSRRNPFKVQVMRNRKVLFSARAPTVEDAVRARDEWLASQGSDEWLAHHGEQG